MKLSATLFLSLALSVSALAAENTLTVAGLAFAGPEKAVVVPSSSPMRAGTLRIPVEGSEQPLEAIFYYFGAGQGGDADANVTRWFRQFEGQPETSREEIDAGGKKVTLVTAKGTYLDGPPMAQQKTPRPGYTLLGAIVPAADANVFIKLTGPADAVAKATPGFRALAVSPFAK